MNLDEAAIVLHFALALMLLWGLVFFCWRDYRISALRDDLFALRDEMFDYAAAGHVKFTDPAYTDLRQVMNGAIRFAHRLTASRLFLLMLVHRLWPNAAVDGPGRYHAWQKAVDQIPDPEVRARLLGFHSRMSQRVAKHVVTGSPILLAAFIVCVILPGAAKLRWERTRRRFESGLNLLEAQVSGVDLLARQGLLKAA